MTKKPRIILSFLLVFFLFSDFICKSDNKTSNNSANIEIIYKNPEQIKNNPSYQSDSNLILAKQKLHLSEKQKYTNGIQQSYFYIADIFKTRNMNDSAIYYFEKGLYTIDNNPELKADFYWNLAILYRITGNYSASLEASLNAKSIVESQKISKYSYKIYNLLALSYQTLMEYELAKENYIKSATIALESGNESYTGIISANLGKLYFEQDSLDKALEYLHKGVQLEEKYELYGSAGNSYTILAKIFMKKDMLDSAIVYLYKATELNRKSDNKMGLAHTLLSVSEYYFNTDSLDEALFHLDLTIKYATPINLKSILSDAYHLKAEIFAKQKDYQKAYENFERFYKINSELYNVEKINKAKAIEQRLIQQEKENELFELKLLKQKTINILLISIVSLAFIFGIIAIIYLVKFKKLNRELLNSKDKAEESDKLKSRFLQTISHEIRTPLNGIIGFSEMITAKSLSDAEMVQINDLILKNSDDLISTIENLVDIAHLSTKQYNVKKATFELSDLLKSVFEKAENSIVFRNKTDVKLELKKNEPIEIYSDKNIIFKIIQHIAKNAILFTNKGEITLGYNIEKSNVIIFVKDTGIGISQDKIDIIFSPFRNAEENINIKVGGTGLGLTIVNELIQILGGKVWVGSEVKKGTTFYVSLPVN